MPKNTTGSESKARAETPKDGEAANDKVAETTAAVAQRAYLAKGGTLLEVQSDGKTKELGAFGPATWCQVDTVGDVVWGLGETGLQALDLKETKLHTIVAGKTIESVEMRFPSGSPIGNANGLETEAALIVSVNDAPSMKGEIICDGDLAYDCYESTEGEQSTWVPTQDAKKARDAYNAFKLEDGDFLKTIASRGKARVQAKTPKQKTPEKPTLTIAKDGCAADPESCGDLTYVGGKRFWSVITGNDRGDFYYEYSQLYDSQKNEFVDFSDNKRQATPFETKSSVELLVSQDGNFALTQGGKLVDLSKAEIVAELGSDVLPCGWR